VIALALFVGDNDTAREILRDCAAKRIAKQIDPDGRQPGTQPHRRWITASKTWKPVRSGPAGRTHRAGPLALPNRRRPGIRAALDWLIDHRTNWKHEQITSFNDARLLPLLRRAALHYQEKRYEDLITGLRGIDPVSDRINLLYPRQNQSDRRSAAINQRQAGSRSSAFRRSGKAAHHLHRVNADYKQTLECRRQSAHPIRMHRHSFVLSALLISGTTLFAADSVPPFPPDPRQSLERTCFQTGGAYSEMGTCAPTLRSFMASTPACPNASRPGATAVIAST